MSISSIALFWLMIMGSALFIRKTVLSIANAYLGMAYISMAHVVFYSVIFQNQQYLSGFVFLHFDHVFFYLLFPCLYLHVRFTLYPEESLQFRQKTHLFVALPAVVYFALGQLPADRQYPDSVLSAESSVIEYLIHVLGFILLLTYFYLTLRMIVRFRQTHRDCTDKFILSKLYWFKRLIPISFVLFTFLFLLEVDLQIPNEMEISVYVFFGFLCTILFLGQVRFYEETERPYKPDGDNKYAKSKLDSLLLKEYIVRLRILMDSEQLFLRANISHREVAEKLSISDHHLSQALNVVLKKSFSVYVNELRIQHACKLFQDPANDRYTLESIALTCGFGSRERFDVAFKKITGMTPSSFRSRIKSR